LNHQTSTVAWPVALFPSRTTNGISSYVEFQVFSRWKSSIIHHLVAVWSSVLLWITQHNPVSHCLQKQVSNSTSFFYHAMICFR
jgi:hypothetical protein